MSREIKFRGQISQGLRNAGCWVYWGLSGTDMLDSIDSDTIGQYTGLKDKNGVEIYEGDVIALEPDKTKEYANEPHYSGLNYGDICTVEWSDTNLAYYLIPVDDNIEEQRMDYFGSWFGWNWIKFIGNIYENPEFNTKEV